MDYDRFNPVRDFREEQGKQIEDINRIAKQYEPDFSEMFGDDAPIPKMDAMLESLEKTNRELEEQLQLTKAQLRIESMARRKAEEDRKKSDRDKVVNMVLTIASILATIGVAAFDYVSPATILELIMRWFN